MKLLKFLFPLFLIPFFSACVMEGSGRGTASKAISKFSSAEIRQSTTVEKTSFDKNTKIVGKAGVIHEWANGTARWFLRSWIGESGESTHQLYIEIEYGDNWRFYETAQTTDAQSVDLVIIDRDVNCTSSNCYFKEVVGVNLSRDFLKTKIDTGFRIRLLPKKFAPFFVTIPGNYVFGYLQSVDDQLRLAGHIDASETAQQDQAEAEKHASYEPTKIASTTSETGNQQFFVNMDNDYICMNARDNASWSKSHLTYVQEAKRRGLSCGVVESVQTATSSSQIASSSTSELSVFGLKFGGGIEQNKYPKIDNLMMASEFTNHPCEKAIASITFGAVPDHWKINIMDIFGLGKIPSSSQVGFMSNKIGADLSLNGRVTGGIYKINVLNGDYKICFAYLDNKLFHVHSPYKELRDIWDEIGIILKTKYGEGKISGKDGVYLTTWTIKEGLLIRKVLPLDLTYTFAPLQSEFLQNAVPLYIKKEKEAGVSYKNTF